jgi:TDG/mug DNA glycosylase family protein
MHRTPQMPQHIEHSLDPIFDARAHVLILGTMPSPLSREQQMYYGNPRNRFWPVLAALFDEPAPHTPQASVAFARAHDIAIWDVLASCTIAGASDMSITDARSNDLSCILTAAPISAIFTTGSTAARLYHRLQLPVTGIEATSLPSTSPANASWSLSRLIDAYRAIADALDRGLDEDGG